MNNRYKYLLKNIGLLTISNFSSKILILLLVPLYTNVLTTEEFGIFDLVISTIQLLVPILTLNIVDAVMRFSMDIKASKQDVVSIGLLYITRSCFLVVICLLISHYTNLIPNIYDYELLIVVYYVFYVLNQFFIQLAKGLERVKDMAVSGILGTIVMLLFNIIFLLVVKKGLIGFFWANAFAQMISALYLALQLKFWKYLKVNLDQRLKKEMLIYSLPLALTTIGWWINNASDKYIVTFMCGIGASGLLSVAYKIPGIIMTFQNIFIQAWLISAIREYGEEGDNKFYSESFVYLNILMCLVCSLLIILLKPIANILYAKDFYAAWQFVPFLLVSSVLNASSGFVGPILSAAKNSKAMAKAAIYGAATNVIVSLILVHIMDVQGAVVATLISSYVIYIVRKKAVGKLLDSPLYSRVMISWLFLCIQTVLAIYVTEIIFQFVVMISLLFLYKTPIINISIELKCRFLNNLNNYI